MAARTDRTSPLQSADGRPAGNAQAGWSVAVGLLGVAVLPAAIAATRWSRSYELLHAALAIPFALLLGLASISLARSARARSARTLGRAGGDRAARVGRALGLLALFLAGTAIVSVVVYGLLDYAGTRE